MEIRSATGDLTGRTDTSADGVWFYTFVRRAGGDALSGALAAGGRAPADQVNGA
ncbi:MAG TPA: hypothetical protein VFM55_08925 [Micromonosporaceae bacterium]|nr:hypothetical protein [Micromonosporaceae bacterium]